MTLPAIFTLEEVAERLKVSKNALARVARRTGNASVMGRTLLFSEADVEAIWEAIRLVPSNHKSGSVLGISELELSKRAASFLNPKPKRNK